MNIQMITQQLRMESIELEKRHHELGLQQAEKFTRERQIEGGKVLRRILEIGTEIRELGI